MYKKIFLLISVIFLISIFLIIKFNNYYTLLFIDKNSGKKLLDFKIKEGEVFKISFKHSVALTDVTEFYKIENGEIHLYEMDFYDQCAGLPTEPYGDEKLILDGRQFRLINLDRKFKEILYGIIKECNYRLFIKGVEINLSKEFGTKTVIIMVRR